MTDRSPRTVVVDCTVDVADTADSLHAHVELDGAPDIGPGDSVTVGGAPIGVAPGQRIVLRRRATIKRSTWLQRVRTRASAYCGLTGLLEIGFSVGRDR